LAFDIAVSELDQTGLTRHLIKPMGYDILTTIGCNHNFIAITLVPISNGLRMDWQSSANALA